jgi:hypothetical protein
MSRWMAVPVTVRDEARVLAEARSDQHRLNLPIWKNGQPNKAPEMLLWQGGRSRKGIPVSGTCSRSETC